MRSFPPAASTGRAGSSMMASQSVTIPRSRHPGRQAVAPRSSAPARISLIGAGR
jgi:hypothetical protein